MSYAFVNRPTVKLDIVEATDYYKDISCLPQWVTHFFLVSTF
jgi:hypothetical protein